MEKNYILLKLHFVAENRLSPDSETIEDLRRLCIVFQHVEKLLTLAASLHRKFLQAPRLAREIFSDFYNFYIPRLGIGLVEEKVKCLNTLKCIMEKISAWTYIHIHSSVLYMLRSLTRNKQCGMKREKRWQICLFNPLQTNLGERF